MARTSHPAHPPRQKAFPEGDASADADTGAVAFGQADLVAGLGGGQHQTLGVTEKPAAGGRETGAGPVAREQARTQFVFQTPDARTDRRLGQVHLPGGLQETAVGCDREKGAGLVDIHRLSF